MAEVSKIVLDDSEYFPKLEMIAEGWERAAEAEEDALARSSSAMQERVQGLDALDQSFVSNAESLRKVKAAEDVLNRSRELSVKSNSLYSKSVNRVTGVLKRWSDSNKKLQSSEKAITKERRKHLRVLAESKKAFKDQIADTDILGTNLGKVNKSVRAGIVVGKSWIKVLGVTRVALLATGIGAFVVVLGSLITYLKNTVEGSDFLNRKMAALGAVFNSLKDVVIKLGGSIFKAVSDPLAAIKNFGKGVAEFIQNPVKKAREMWTKFRGEVQGIVEDARLDAATAEAIAKQRQILREEERKLRVEFAKTRAEIEKRKKGSDDINKSIEERQKLAQEAFKMENDLLKKQTGLAQKNVDLITLSNSLSTSGLEDLDNLADAEIELADIKQSSLTLQTELQNKINGLSKEAHDKELASIKEEQDARDAAFEKQKQQLEELKKQYQDIATGLMQTVLDLEFEQASPLEKVFLKEEKALAELAATRAKFLDTSKKALAAGLVSEEDIQKQIDNLDIIEAVTKKKFSREADLIKLPVKAAPTLELDKFDVKLPDPKKLTGALKPVITDPIKKSFTEAFAEGLEDAVIFFEDNQEQFDAFKNFFSDLTSLFTSGIDSQIAKIDELIAKNDEKISELENQLEKQKEAEDEGLARSIETLESQIAEEKAKREQAIEQRQALEKKAAKAQLVNDIVQQSASLVTASANIFKAMSSIPFVGVPLAIGFIATMFGAFAKSKIDAAKAAKLYKGTGQLDSEFKTYTGPKSDLYGNGYKVVDADTGQDMGVRISGKEPLINEAVGQGVNRGFFEDLNRNPQKWQNFDIRKAIAEGVGSVKETVDYANDLENGTSTPINYGSGTSRSKKSIQYLTGKPTYKVINEGGIETIVQL